MLGLLLCLLVAPAAGTPISFATSELYGAPAVGAWDVGPFDNDDAADWYLAFAQAPSWATVARTLATAETRQSYLEVDDASVAVAAAAVVAAIRTGKLEALPSEGRANVARLDKPSSELAASAIAALDRVQAESELADLWSEGGNSSPWLATLDAIRSDLH